MTEDPSRLLSQESDAFAASLLKSARDGDRDAARSHKAAVLGAAGGAAVGGAAITAASRLSSRGLFSMLGGKWLVAAMVTLGGLGTGAALLWPRDWPRDARTPSPSDANAPVASDVAAPPPPGAEPARVPSPNGDPASNQGASVPSPGAPSPAESAPSLAESAPSPAESGGAGPLPATARDTTGAAEPSDPSARSKITSPAQEVKPSPSATATAPNAPGAASPSGAAPGLAEEVAALRAAHEALGRGQSQRCLDAVNAYFAAFPNGHLSAEARYLRVEAMFAGGQKQQAAALARSMLVANPRSPYAARLRTIAGDPAP